MRPRSPSFRWRRLQEFEIGAAQELDQSQAAGHSPCDAGPDAVGAGPAADPDPVRLSGIKGEPRTLVAVVPRPVVPDLIALLSKTLRSDGVRLCASREPG